MSAALHLAKVDDLDRLLPLVERFHATQGIDSTEETRRRALAPLLAGTPHGVAYLIGPRRGPVGYIIVGFGYSVELGGVDAFIDEFYIREKIRRRGLGSEVLQALAPALAEHGVKALHLEADRDAPRAQGFYQKNRFAPRDRYFLMTRLL